MRRSNIPDVAVPLARPTSRSNRSGWRPGPFGCCGS